MKYKRLEWSLFYEAGPIDEAVDFTSWRNDISQFLWSLGAGVLDPCNKPTDDNEDNAFRKKLTDLKDHKNWNELSSLMRRIVTVDLHLVDLSTAVILHLDKKIHMCGSYFEANYGCLERKPLIVHCPTGKNTIPNWLFGITKHELFFETWDQVKEYLRHIHEDESVNDLGGRWKFLDYDKIFGRTKNV